MEPAMDPRTAKYIGQILHSLTKTETSKPDRPLSGTDQAKRLQAYRAAVLEWDETAPLPERSPAPSSEKQPFDWVAYEKKRAEWANQEEGSLKGYDCPACKNRGWKMVVDDAGYRRAKECACMAVRRNRERIANSGLGEMLQRCTFGTWEVREPWQREALEAAKRYAAHPSGWLIAFGRSGTGKTHLCTAICGELMERGIDTRYCFWRDFATKAKAVVNDQAAYSALVEPLKQVQALYIDDLFKMGRGQVPTTADRNLAYEILNVRYNETGKITILSTEWRVERLLELDEGVGSRIYERCKGNGISFVGRPNWRTRGRHIGEGGRIHADEIYEYGASGAGLQYPAERSGGGRDRGEASGSE